MMSASASSPPKPSIWRKSPNLAGLGVLLDHISEAALIIDRSRSTVLLANPAFLTLTARSANDVANLPFKDVFHDAVEELLAIDEEKTARLVRKNRAPLEISYKISPIDPSGQWGMATFQIVQRELQPNWHETLLNGLAELARLAAKGSLQGALEQAIQILHDVLGLELIGVYQADSGYPRLRLASAFDPALVLPDTLPVTDLIRLSSPQIWFPGRRVSTELYRNGRIKTVTYLASTPLGQEGAWLGLLVVGDRQAQPINNLMQYVSVMGAMLSTAIEHYILVANQQLVIEKQHKALALQTVLSEHVREGVVLVNPDMTIESINPVAEVMLGYTEKEARHEPVENILIGSERLLPAINEAQRGIATNDLGDTQLHRRDGHAFPAMIQTIPVETDGGAQSTLVLISDTSTDEQNKIRTRQLEQRAVIGEVIQVFAHEVRNPINNIGLTLEDLAGRYVADDPIQEIIGRMQGDCFRLSHLMETILSSSRPEPRFEKVELSMLLRKLIERWRPRFAKVNVSPYSQFDPKTPPIRADARSLEQVFTNLISNAVDAMAKQGGGTLAVKLAPYNMIPNLSQVEVTITDDGPGIPDEIRDHIFEPFVSNNPRGTGLGLAITKQIVTTHRGSIQVNTFPGGTVFQVIFPALINGEQ